MARSTILRNSTSFMAGENSFYKYKANNKDGIRIFVNKDSGVSILPVDYVAKAIVRAFL